MDKALARKVKEGRNVTGVATCGDCPQTTRTCIKNSLMTNFPMSVHGNISIAKGGKKGWIADVLVA